MNELGYLDAEGGCVGGGGEVKGVDEGVFGDGRQGEGSGEMREGWKGL